MAYTRKSSSSSSNSNEATSKVFHSVGALFSTSSDNVPFVGAVDEDVLKALGLEAPEGKEYKLFTRTKTSKSGREYISLYLGLSDIRK